MNDTFIIYVCLVMNLSWYFKKAPDGQRPFWQNENIPGPDTGELMR